MHFVFIVLGVFLGAWIASSGTAFLGAAAGAIIASLLFRLSDAQSKIGALTRRVDRVERLKAIPDKALPLESPQPVSVSKPAPLVAPDPPRPDVPVVAKATAPVERVSLYESKVEPGDSPALHRLKPIVHPRQPEPPLAPSPGAHTIEVAKRWLTTGNVAVKMGVILSFFGVAFLLKYAVDNQVFEIPIWLRYLAVAAFATVLLVLGWRMRERERVYALSLQGGGIGILFLTIFAAFRVHPLLPPSVAFVLLVLITVATGWLAIKQESRALAILGTTGGFLAPILTSTGSANHVGLFTYYLILNCTILGVAWYRPWRELNIIGFVFTFGIGTIWGYQYYVPYLFATTEPFLVLYFLFYTAIAVLFAFRQAPKLRGYVDGTLLFGTPSIAFALQSQLLQNSEYGLSISAAVVAVLYAVLALWLRGRKQQDFALLTQTFIVLAIAFATLAIPLALDDRWTAIAWALEGAALVWIGVRQSGTLAKLSGTALSFAAGVEFLKFGWVHDLGIPVLNGNFLGGALIMAAALYSSRKLLGGNGNGDNKHDWQGVASLGLLVWGLAWWFGAGAAEIVDRVGTSRRVHVMLLFTGFSFAAMAFAARHFRWLAIKRTTLVFLPLLLLFVVAYLVEHEHFFRGMGILAWLAAIAAHFWILFVYESEENPVEKIWHTWGGVFFTGLLAYEFYWQVDRVVSNNVWSGFTGLLVLAIVAAAIFRERGKLKWPVGVHFEAYLFAGLILVATYLVVLTGWSIDEPGNPDPLVYIPILNPFDLLAIAGLGVAWHALQTIKEIDRWRPGDSAPLFALGGLAFLLSTLSVIRAVHHYTGVAWDQHELMSSVALQSTLSIYWAILGLTGMVLGTRRVHRSVWMIGTVMMGVVVAKLFVIDLGNTGTVARIVSFLGVGITLLIVGYFSPVPPKHEEIVTDGGG